jgi:small subunit ribosomal protein S1
MVNRNLIRSLDLGEDEWQQELDEALDGTPPEEIDWTTEDVTVNQIVDGRVLRVEGDYVLVDVGYKSEGIILSNEWEDYEPPPEPGQEVKVLVEDVEDVYGLVDDSRGMISLSKRKAEKIQRCQAADHMADRRLLRSVTIPACSRLCASRRKKSSSWVNITRA